MASISWDIMQDIAKMRADFKNAGNFEAVHVTHLAEDKADAISKLHLPAVEYFDRLIGDLESVKGMSFTSENEVAILTEIIELVNLHKSVYTD